MVSSANDWSTLELDLRRRPRERQGQRQRSFAMAIISQVNTAAEGLHPRAAYSRCRPQAVTRRSRFRAAKPTFADRASDWGWPTRCPVAASSVCERGIDRPDGVLSKACAGTFRHRQQISPAHLLVQPAADRDG